MSNAQFASDMRAIRPLPTAAPQQSGNVSSNVITLQRAIATNVNPAVLRAVANWNERKSYDERRRKARSRLKSQTLILRQVADELETHDVGMEVALAYPRAA